jgi:hypothetical protein
MVLIMMSTFARFTSDRKLDIALQHVSSHVDLKYNEIVDKLADDGALCPPGSYGYSINDSDHFSALGVLPPLAVWPEGAAPPPKLKSGTQTIAYHNCTGAAWLSGVGRQLIGARLARWWPRYVNSAWVLQLFHKLCHNAPRLLWSFWSMLLGEWPTGRRLRHLTSYGRLRPPVPPCRFCGRAADCVVHWFGPRSCRTLYDLSARHIALPDYPTYGAPGFISLSIDDPRWFQLMQWFKSVQSLLQWGAPDDMLSQTLLLREGTWIARSTQRNTATHNNLLTKARNSARRRAANRVKELKKVTLTTCACGQIHRRGEHRNCVLLALRYERVILAGNQPAQ